MGKIGASRALIFNDSHIPFHDERAYNLMLYVAKDVGIDEIVIAGDFCDFYSINQYGKNPGIDFELEEERHYCRRHLRELREEFPDAKIVFMQGNHEYRLERFIEKNCPQFYSEITTDKFLGLKDYKMQYVKYGPSQYYYLTGSKLIIKHEPLSGGVHCAYQTVTKASHSVLFGHTHRIQEHQIVSIKGENLRGISNGWLGDKSSPVFNYVKGHHQWALGFSLVTVLDSGIWLNQLVHIIPKGNKYYCQVNGDIYEN